MFIKLDAPWTINRHMSYYNVPVNGLISYCTISIKRLMHYRNISVNGVISYCNIPINWLMSYFNIPMNWLLSYCNIPINWLMSYFNIPMNWRIPYFTDDRSIFFPSTCWLRPIVHIDLYKDEVKKNLEALK